VESYERCEGSNAKPFSAPVIECVHQYCYNAVIYSAVNEDVAIEPVDVFLPPTYEIRVGAQAPI